MMLASAAIGSAAAMAGTLIGTFIHELSHAVMAQLVGGSVERVGWNNGLRGGPVVIWRPPDESGWRPRLVGFAPLLAGIIAASLLWRWQPRGVAAFGALGFLASLLVIGSREDISPEAARETAADMTD